MLPFSSQYNSKQHNWDGLARFSNNLGRVANPLQGHDAAHHGQKICRCGSDVVNRLGRVLALLFLDSG